MRANREDDPSVGDSLPVRSGKKIQVVRKVGAAFIKNAVAVVALVVSVASLRVAYRAEAKQERVILTAHASIDEQGRSSVVIKNDGGKEILDVEVHIEMDERVGAAPVMSLAADDSLSDASLEAVILGDGPVDFPVHEHDPSRVGRNTWLLGWSDSVSIGAGEQVSVPIVGQQPTLLSDSMLRIAMFNVWQIQDRDYGHGSFMFNDSTGIYVHHFEMYVRVVAEQGEERRLPLSSVDANRIMASLVLDGETR